MDDSGVVLRRTDVGGVFKGDPGVPRLEEHREHLAPQHVRLDPLVLPHLAFVGHPLVLDVALLERFAVEVVQVGNLVRGEERPLTPLHSRAL